MQAPHDVIWRDRPGKPVAGRGLCNVGIVVGLALGIVSPIAAQAPPPELSIDQLHIFVMPAGDHVVISEHYLLGNAGTLAYAGEEAGEPTVVFSLPVGAVDVRPGDANDPADRYEVIDTDAGDLSVADTQPILPGTATSEVRFSYSLPLTLGEIIRREVPLPANSCVILIAGDQWRLEGPALISFGTMDVGGESAHAYTLDPLVAGDTFSFSVIEAAAGMDAAADGAAAMTEVPRGVGIGAGLVALGAAAVVVYALNRQKPVPALPSQLRDDIVALVELDDRYGAGELAEADYLTRREEIKTRIRGRLQSSGLDD